MSITGHIKLANLPSEEYLVAETQGGKEVNGYQVIQLRYYTMCFRHPV